MRIAVWRTELSRKGPGLLLRDIQRGEDPQITAMIQVLIKMQPDILVMAGFDWDYEARALTAFQDALKQAGHGMPHSFAPQSNRGLDTGLDLNANGRLGEAEDAQGFAEFTGADSLAIISRWPIGADTARVDTDLLWADLPNALLPYPGQPDGLETVRRLSTTAHWVVPITPDGQPPLYVGSFFATAPVFDGPEDRNGRRNHDEVAYWSLLLDGAFGAPLPERFVLAGHANLDPDRGDGRRGAIANLLTHPRLQDPHPGQPTVDWRRDDLEPLRVSYVLPDTSFEIEDSGVLWPTEDAPASDHIDPAGRHRLVWVDLVPR